MRFPFLVLLCLFATSLTAAADESESLSFRNNRFAFELYSKVASAPGNVFISPYSVSSAMAMVHEGARGETAREIASVFHFEPEPERRRKSWAESIALMNAGDGVSLLGTANALWAQKAYGFSPEYLDAVLAAYGGAATNLDFIGDGDGSRKTINGWVEDRTKGKIRDLLPPGTVTEQTRLILTNAVYFKGQWANEFDTNNTRDAAFTSAGGVPVMTKMMSMGGMDSMFGYAETDGVQAVELPYKGGAMSMVLILPQNRDFPAFEKRLNVALFEKIVRALSVQEIVLQFPKFKFEAKYFMRSLLIGMGLAESFDPQRADFSGMTGKRDLYISEVIHQSLIDVTEQGTEAAAATAISMLAGAGMRAPKPIPVFKADHPFLFAILDKRTGAVLFMGRMAQPAVTE